MALPNVQPNGIRPASQQSMSYQSEMMSMAFKGFSESMEQFMSKLSARLETVVSPGLAVKQAAYGAFGNNMVTRGGIAAFDALSDATEGLFGAPEDKEAESDPLSKALKLQTEELKSAILSIGEINKKSGLSEDEKKLSDKMYSKIDDIQKKLQELIDKECCGDSDKETKVSKVQSVAKLALDSRYKKVSETYDNAVNEKLKNAPATMNKPAKSIEALLLKKILEVLVQQSKSIEKMSAGPLQTQEAELEANLQKKLPAFDKNTIDVEAKVVKDKSDSGWFSKLFENFKTLSTVVSSISSVFQSAGKVIMSVVGTIGSLIAKLLGSKASDVGKSIAKIGGKALAVAGTAVAAGTAIAKSAGSKISEVASDLFGKSKTDIPALNVPENMTRDTGVKKIETNKPTVDGKGIAIEDAKIKKDPLTTNPSTTTIDKKPTVDGSKGIDIEDAKIKKDIPNVPEKKGMLGKIGEKLGGVAKGAAKVGKMIPGIGFVIGAADAAYSAGSGALDAEKIFGTEQASTSQRVAGGLGGIVESASFGLLDRDSTSRKMHEFFSKFSSTENKPADLDESLKRSEGQKDESKKNAAPIITNITNNSSSNVHTSPRAKPMNTDISFSRYVDSAMRSV